MISSSQVKSLAASLGFDACGIARVDAVVGAGSPRPQGAETAPLPFLKDLEHLKRWVTEGRHCTMKYLEDFESRAKKFWGSFPEARSIIVVGVNYYSRHPEGRRPEGSRSFAELRLDCRSAQDDSQASGRVARYAWGKDYHRAIGKRLEVFREKLAEAAGRPIRAEICVDTKPLLERSLAQRAGLGFIGKQSQLLSPKFGPWLFLAELVTDLELEPDLPYLGSCGECRICIDECPTEAIQPEGGIDARRCIAYLTIEHKGKIAEELKPLMGDWVFGCDICLQVCPYASKGKETRWEELKAESGFGPYLDLAELARISSNGAYEKKFAETALTRASRKQLFRNIAVVLKNKEGCHDDESE